MNRKALLSLTTLLVISLSGAHIIAHSLEGGPRLSVGDRFHFRTVSTIGTPSTSTGFETARGPAVIPPLPNEQWVRITGERKCHTGSCLILEVQRKLPPFLPGLQDRAYSETIRAHIDKATGEVFDIETIIMIGKSESRSTQSLMSRDSTLADFYGPWMLDLRAGYTSSTVDSMGVTRNLEVTGKQSVSGRECFVVKETRVLPSGEKAETIWWVDTHRRVAIQVNRGKRKMKLIK